MKKKNVLLSLVLACILSVSVYGQKVTRDEWRRQLQAQESIINDYVRKKLDGPSNEALLKQFYDGIAHEKGIKSTDLPSMLSAYLKDHYRMKYFEENPGMVAIYNPGRVQLTSSTSSNAAPAANIRNVACFNGNFEDDLSLSSYAGYTGPMYTGNECTFVPTGPVAYTPTSFGVTDAFMLTNNVPDPMIPGLNQTNNGSPHAIRINAPTPCTPNRGINMLQRSFTTPTTGTYRINFSYALVMENPKGHGNAQPFFVARVLDGSGTEVGSRICRISDLTNPIYNTTGYRPRPGGCGNSDSLVWRDWTCASIVFQGDPSQTFTIEFFAADCAAGAHFGYAYVDDICASECCPKFFMRDCCDMHGGSSSGNTAAAAMATAANTGDNNPTVKEVLDRYNQNMRAKYNWSANNGPDPCCNPCAYPNDPYPVFIMDEFNNLISSTDYSISWSHDPGNTSAYAFILPNQQTIVTVRGPGSCVWTDTLKLNCCSDTIKITPFCTWDPCKYPNSPFPVRVLDQNGNTLTSAGGYTFLWQYGVNTSTGDAITATLASFPIIVKVKYPNGCEYTDTLDMRCCKANTPINLKCKQESGGSHLYWDPVPGTHYQVILTVGDPDCCGSAGTHPYTITWNVSGTDTLVPTSVANCFSWKVIAICPDGSKSQESVKACSCGPRCDPKQPINLKCRQEQGGSHIYWDAVPGTHYKVIITVNDPDCCGDIGQPYTMVWDVAGNDTLVPTTVAGCFSWKVVSICPDGSKSPESDKACSCGPRCDPKQPINLKCREDKYGSHLYWDPVPGTHYKLFITVNDPDCCGDIGQSYTFVWDVAGTDTLVPVTVAGCFSWKVVAICPDGTKSPESKKQCSCAPRCDPKRPENLKCKEDKLGSYLYWDPIPGMHYKVIINVNDPDCCGDAGQPYTMVWDVAGNDTLVPITVGCFSWQVISICPDGTKSPESDKKCSCSPKCEPKEPQNLKCEEDKFGSHLYWDPVPGAHYKLVINVGDPDCCGDQGTHPYSIVWDVAGTDTIVPASFAPCFSWLVIAICPDGEKSPESKKMCSCSPKCKPTQPENLRCRNVRNGNQLYWDPIPGAHYKLIINVNDPDCCRGDAASLPYSMVWDVAGTDTLVPNWIATCFSWQVVAICPDGEKSPESEKKCSCTSTVISRCNDPYKLKCAVIRAGVQLSWAPTPGAGGYELEITYDDPACCRSNNLPTMSLIGLGTNNYVVTPGTWRCFSWRVRAKCDDGYSNWVSGGCNCTSATTPGTPADPAARTNNSGNSIRLEAVPNPASDYVDFSLYGIDNVQNKAMEIVIHDITGREVARKAMNADAKVRFDVYSLNPGLYIYKLLSNGEQYYSGKIMIERK